MSQGYSPTRAAAPARPLPEESSVLKYIARRFVNYLILVFVATSLAYLLASYTLNPIANYLHGQHVNLVSVHNILRGYNVDPRHLDLGPVLALARAHRLPRRLRPVLPSGDSVTSDVIRKSGVSLRLLLVGSILSVVIGVLVGVYSALHQYKRSDHTISVISFILLSTPIFLLATMLKLGAIKLGDNYGIHIPDVQRVRPGAGRQHRGPRAAPGAAHRHPRARRGRRGVLRPLPAQRHARRAGQRLPAHGPGQGTEPAQGASTSTACAPR